MEIRHVSFDHTRLGVHLAGTGPLAVLLHGFPLDSRMWIDAMTHPMLEGRTLAAIDLLRKRFGRPLGEIRSLISDEGDNSTLDEDEREMIQSIFNFHDTAVREIMIPRIDMTALDGESDVAESVASEQPLGVSVALSTRPKQTTFHFKSGSRVEVAPTRPLFNPYMGAFL